MLQHGINFYRIHYTTFWVEDLCPKLVTFVIHQHSFKILVYYILYSRMSCCNTDNVFFNVFCY